MIDLHYWPTPNGHKITLLLEEAGLDYRIVPVNIGEGAQFEPDFLEIAPNNRMPAIVDHAPADGGDPISVFESGAILLYLAEKTGRFHGPDARTKIEQLQWLMWQMGGLGPMLGQNHHFNRYAPEKIPYAIDRYVKETARLYGVLDRRLEDFPNLKRWFEAIRARPATVEAYRKGDEVNPPNQPMSEKAKSVLFGLKE